MDHGTEDVRQTLLNSGVSFPLMKTKLTSLLLTLLTFPFTPSAQPQLSTYDVLIKNGAVYDGTGAASINADVAIKGDRIVAIGNLRDASATTVIDARGLAVAP